MKILVMGDRKRYEKYAPQMNIIEKSEIIYIARDACTAAALEAVSYTHLDVYKRQVYNK